VGRDARSERERRRAATFPRLEQRCS
jgi:hypothetical protein